MKILIVEDDTYINNMLAKLLTSNSYQVVQAFSGTEAIMVLDSTINLILLDLMLPGKNGEEVIASIKDKSTAPIIIMSAITDTSKKLELFSAGVKDYITKPFDNDELLARIRVHLKDLSEGESIISYKDILLDIKNYKVMVRNQELELTKNEFLLLKVLVQNQGQVLTKEKLFELVWGYDDAGDDNTLNVHISKLRNKIRSITNDDYIETVWSIGYRLKK